MAFNSSDGREGIAKVADRAHVAGLDAITLINLIRDARPSAAERKELFGLIEVIAYLLTALEESHLRLIREPLVDLEGYLRQTYLLLAEYQKHGYVYKFVMWWQIDHEFKFVTKQIGRMLRVMQLTLYVEGIRKLQIAITTKQEGGGGDEVDEGEELIQNIISKMQLLVNGW